MNTEKQSLLCFLFDLDPLVSLGFSFWVLLYFSCRKFVTEVICVRSSAHTNTHTHSRPRKDSDTNELS